MNKTRSFAVIAGLLSAAAAFAQQQPRSASPSDRDRVGAFISQREPAKLTPPVAEGFKPVFVVPKFKPIIEAPVLKRQDVGDQVTDAELVLGVVVNGQPRAYPINMLTGPEREVINDTVGGRPVAATWCHLCNNAVVYDRRVADRTLTFAVSGMLWNRNLVMYDVETDSLWAHLLGEAKQGPLIGTKLSIVPGEMTTWADWAQRHPDTTFLSMSRTATAYKSGVYEDQAKFVFGWLAGRRAFHVGIDALEKNPVRNVESNGKALLVSFERGATRAVLASRDIDGKTLTFERQSDGKLRDKETGSIWDAVILKALSGPLAGRQLAQEAGMFAFRDAWTEFHPTSEIVP